ncbi:conserved exported hypothetical protein [Magnetospirillum sp. LM-5]|uniref:hypothetical protein n=1 Tax=Magnetospirillum sp. LM-5 TaxID=2681466 RepID=UPI00137FCCA2|nr:hypothetical protein [Magnetospirillum sp. LM-5]CAA7619567.1 conserved exported hypothetical protein [Magnetospirillum sp. LM-5]
MRILPAIVVALGLAFAATGAGAQGAAFLSAYEDLPLAPGLTEVAGAGLSFDTPQGRIVEAMARSGAKAADILSFYAETLPQLGWSKAGDARYRRDAEVLTIEARPDGRQTLVHFTISPE